MPPVSGPLSAIVAATSDGGIGWQGSIPWDIPADRSLFQRRTLYQPVIMGRKTYESLPEKVRPLPKRFTIVVSRSSPPRTSAPGFVGLFWCHSIEAALSTADRLLPRCTTREILIAGGAEIYESLWPSLSFLYVTRVFPKHPIQTDRKIPEISERDFIERYRSPLILGKGDEPDWSFHQYEAVADGRGIL